MLQLEIPLKPLSVKRNLRGQGDGLVGKEPKFDPQNPHLGKGCGSLTRLGRQR